MYKINIVRKMWEQHTFICCSIIFLLLVSAVCVYGVSVYPRVEFELASSGEGDPVLVYYTDDKMEHFDDEHMVRDVVRLGTQKYSFAVRDAVSLRIDFGTSIGTTEIRNVTVKTFWTTKEVSAQYMAACSFSADVGTVNVEGDILQAESIGADPYIVLGTLDDIDGVIHWKKLVILLLLIVFIIVTFAVVVKYCGNIKSILNGAFFIDEKKKWAIVSVVLLLAAVIRYFWRLGAWPCFDDDEFQTVGAAYGYFKTGTFYQWDFVNNCTSNAYYNRAWPYTILLANWIRIFGLSEISCRAMSALLGVFLIASCIYITKKWFHDIGITCITVIIVLVNPIVTLLFRYTRMYALCIPLCLWMVYFGFRALTEKNQISENTKNRWLIFVKNNFDFHIGYTIVTLILLYFGWHIHVNSLTLCLGMGLFVFYKACATKERKYIVVSGGIVLLIFIFAFGIAFYEQIKNVWMLGRIVTVFRVHAGLFVKIYKEYLEFILNEFGSSIFGILLLIVYIFAIYKNRGKEVSDRMIYLGSIAFATVLFFVCFTKRNYYAGKYIIMLTPMSAMVYAIGFAAIHQWKKIAGIITGICLIFIAWTNVNEGYDSLYTALDKSDFIPAYETIAKYYDLETDIIPIAGVYTRTYYFSQVANHWIIAGLNTDNSMDTLMEFAKENPEGILSCEYGKLYHLNQGAKELMLKWSDRLAGQGIDSYNVELSHYHFIDGEKTDIAEEVDKYAVDFDREGQSAKILVDVGDFGEDEKILCVKVNVSGIDEEQFARTFQLRLPEDGTGCYQYMLPEGLFDNGNVADIEAENSYAVYGNDILQEFNK